MPEGEKTITFPSNGRRDYPIAAKACRHPIGRRLELRID
jgi:hypothetical protein